MKRYLAAPFRFGRFLGRKLSGDRRDEVRIRLEAAQERLGSREAHIADKLSTPPAAGPKRERSREAQAAVDVGTEVANVVVDPFVGPVAGGLWKLVKAALHLLFEVVGSILDGLSVFDI